MANSQHEIREYIPIEEDLLNHSIISSENNQNMLNFGSLDHNNMNAIISNLQAASISSNVNLNANHNGYQIHSNSIENFLNLQNSQGQNINLQNINVNQPPQQMFLQNTNNTQSTHDSSQNNYVLSQTGYSSNNNTNSFSRMRKNSHNSVANRNENEIAKEIQRFEGVHPKIFDVYDLLNRLSTQLVPNLKNPMDSHRSVNSQSNSHSHQSSHAHSNNSRSSGNTNNQNQFSTNISQNEIEMIRENLIYIEDFFVKSPEWCLSRNVQNNQIRIAIIGSLNSGKSPLVHHFLTGQYQPEESPEGGRFKKQLQIENDNFLLLLREEGDPISSIPFQSNSNNSKNGTGNGTNSSKNSNENLEHAAILEQQVSNWTDAIVFVFNITDLASFQAITTYYERLMIQSNSDSFHEIPIILVGTQDYIDETVNPRVIENHHARALLERFGQPINNYVETCATYGLNVEKVFIDLTKKVIEIRQYDKQILHSYKYHEIMKLQQQMAVSQAQQGQITVPAEQIHNQVVQQPQVLQITQQQQQQQPSKSQDLGQSVNNNDDKRDKNLYAHLQLEGSFQTPKKEEKSIPTIPFSANSKLSRKKSENRSSKRSILPWKTKSATTEINFENPSSLPNTPVHANINNPPRKNTLLQNSSEGTVIRCNYVKKTSSNTASNSSKKFLVLYSNAVLRYYSSRSDFLDGSSSFKQVKLLTCTVKINGLPADLVLQKQLKESTTSVKNTNNPKSEKLEKTSFEIISTEGNKWVFHFESNIERNNWTSDIARLMKSQLENDKMRKERGDNPSSDLSKKTAEFIDLLVKIPGNEVCADCSNRDPQWASINLGILICIRCSGIHRKLGTHISKIRSLDLDDWPKHQQTMMLAIGNRLSNRIWLDGFEGSRLHDNELELHITEKYVNKSYLKPLTPSLIRDLPQALHRSLDLPKNSNSTEQFLKIFHHYPKIQLTMPITGTSYEQEIPIHVSINKGLVLQTQLFIWAKPDCLLIRNYQGFTALDLCETKIEEMNQTNASNEIVQDYLLIKKIIEKGLKTLT